ncbi:class I SAM-dependent methyltransferase [Klenkia sp. LSe6-5]|uniref:Class I SAM-dependent methyltransferase n=1 Tax=Klenkia sesuvii TaxID=3103137 RepID=A0ABU8DX16_9ACTN
MTGGLDPGTWDARRRSFGAVAREYAQLRPGYPADAVAFLLVDRPLRVLDLGAGTGKLTDQLLAAGHEVVAVDPSGDMLAELTARHPRVEAVVGGAEDLPLPGATVDAVVAGQAAHWFDPVRTAPELRRVLRPGGVVGFVWNTRDETVPWVAALGERLIGESRDHDAHQGVVHRFAAALPAEVEEHEPRYVQTADPRPGGGRHRHPQLRGGAGPGRGSRLPRRAAHPPRRAPRHRRPRPARPAVLDPVGAAHPALTRGRPRAAHAAPGPVRPRR